MSESFAMLREALAYPARADEETLLVGTILAVSAGLFARLGVLAVLAVVPAVLLAGYAMAVLQESAGLSDDTSAGGDAAVDDASATTDAPPTDAPPAFEDVRTLAADGARALVVTVGYLGGPTVALAVTLAGSAPAESATVGVSLLVLGAGTVVLFAALSFAYLLPAALVEVARTGSFRAGVAPGRLRQHAADLEYFVGWVTTFVVVGVTGLLFDALAAVGRSGELAGLAVGFYATVAVARLLGHSVSR